MAQTAHCVRIILYMGKSLGGSPTRAKALEVAIEYGLLVSYCTLDVARGAAAKQSHTQHQAFSSTSSRQSRSSTTSSEELRPHVDADQQYRPLAANASAAPSNRIDRCATLA